MILSDHRYNDWRPELTTPVPVSGFLPPATMWRSSQMAALSTLRHIRHGLIVAAALAITPAYAADPDNGERLAQRWCAACHVVSATQRQTTTDQAPPFATIAKIPGFDAAKIALFLLDPHPKMPDMGLSRMEAADLAAYIATLK
ncbi:MAG: c-type cytochrome [Xanthobacteraceae bacterium]